MGERETTWLVPSVGRVGGAEQVTRGLTRYLRSAGWEVRWVAAKDAVLARAPCPLATYRGSGLGAGIPLGLRRGSILHSHFAYAGWGHLLVPSGPTRVRTFYGPWDREGALAEGSARWKSAARGAIENVSLRRADMVIVLSEYSRREVVSRGVREAQTRKIPGFVDPTRFRAADVRLPSRLDPASRWVVCNRRLTPRTGVDRLLRAWPEVSRIHPELRLAIIGDGDQRAHLEGLARVVGVQGTTEFLGSISDSALSEWLLRALVAVIPSVALEGFGMSTVEALWHGRPVVVTPSGASPEIVMGIDARLVSRGAAPHDIARALIEALNRSDAWDPQAARDYVEENFSLAHAGKALVAAYEDLAA